MQAVQPRELHQVAQAARKLAAIGFTEQPPPVLVDGTDLATGIQGAAGAVVPCGVRCHCLGDLLKSLSRRRAAEVEYRQAVGRRASL